MDFVKCFVLWAVFGALLAVAPLLGGCDPVIRLLLLIAFFPCYVLYYLIKNA